MTPQSFSYGIVGNDGFIYLPPYGLNERLDYMLRLDPETYNIKKISLEVDNSYEKWVVSVVVKDKIYVLPYNESSILVIDTTKNTVNAINLNLIGNGKYTSAHVYKDRIYALPFGIDNEFNQVLIFDTVNDTFKTVELQIPINNEKKWHTTQIIGSTIYGMPRGELADPYFPYRIEFNCDTSEYQLIDISNLWKDVDLEGYATAKYTTMAVYKDKLFAPPYCRNPNFDLMAIFVNGQWAYVRTGQTTTSRKYYTHIVSKNGKIYFRQLGMMKTGPS
jgi:hypothetical protein